MQDYLPATLGPGEGCPGIYGQGAVHDPEPHDSASPILHLDALVDGLEPAPEGDPLDHFFTGKRAFAASRIENILGLIAVAPLSVECGFTRFQDLLVSAYCPLHLTLDRTTSGLRVARQLSEDLPVISRCGGRPQAHLIGTVRMMPQDPR